MRKLVFAVIVNENDMTEWEKENLAQCDFYYWASGDYMTHVLYDTLIDQVVYHEDNTHGHPEDFLEGYVMALRATKIDTEVDERVAYIDNEYDENNYIDMCRLMRENYKTDSN